MARYVRFVIVPGTRGYPVGDPQTSSMEVSEDFDPSACKEDWEEAQGTLQMLMNQYLDDSYFLVFDASDEPEDLVED